MADRVIRMKGIGTISHRLESDRVVLIVDGTAGGKHTRVELSLDGYDVRNVVRETKDGVAEQVKFWEETNKAVNNG